MSERYKLSCLKQSVAMSEKNDDYCNSSGASGNVMSQVDFELHTSESSNFDEVIDANR